MCKKLVILVVLLILGMVPAFSQSFGTVANDQADEDLLIDEARGFTAQVEIKTNMFQSTIVTFSDYEDRFKRSAYSLVNNYPFGGINILDGTNVGFAYNGDWYGGGLSLGSSGLGGIKAWIGFMENRIKLSIGNDIGYGYADSQGADAGLRVYDDSVRNQNEGAAEDPVIDTNKNPDNITRDQGVLLEFDFAPVKIALAGGGNFVDGIASDTGNVNMIATGTYTYEPVYGQRFQYGANIGSKIGDYAKVNGAYIIQYNKNQTEYEYPQDEIVPRKADSEITNHLFGAYASAYPFGNDTLGITVGYAGVLVQYLETFSVDIETVKPAVMKNGINLTARYKTEKFTVKTDHNYSFWVDRNYRIFNLHKPHKDLIDYGTKSADTNAFDFADVSHSFLWNGIGVIYQFTPVIEGSLYTRNLLRIDEGGEYRMLNDYYSVELKATFRFSPMVEAYTGITYQYTGRIVSESLSAHVLEFQPGVAAGETNDTRHMIQIPLWLKVKLQK